MNDQIRAALELIADQAPQPEGVRRRATARARQLHRRRTVLAITGVAAAGLAVPTTVIRLAASNPEQPIPGSPVHLADPDPAPGHGNRRTPLAFRAGWLPNGFAETSRCAMVSGLTTAFQERQWSAPSRSTLDDDVPPSVTLAVLPPDEELSGLGYSAAGPAQSVRVGDRPASATRSATGWTVTWVAENSMRLAVRVLGTVAPLPTALRVAESVLPDDFAALESGLFCQWLPPALAVQPQVVRLTQVDQGWQESLILTGYDLAIRYGPGYERWRTSGTGGTPIRFQGNAAYLSKPTKPHRDGDVFILDAPLPGGFGVTVTAKAGAVVGEDEFRRLLGGIRLGSTPATGWMGRR
ncbi:hypothetical protein AB0M47_20240 [Hamadaea sp. NPDC051192]|uniref:hypothetical protein n=1 Tax=Hamadaea sp. NPDC051192 TaxID=3154940 RepID=UPI00342EB315